MEVRLDGTDRLVHQSAFGWPGGFAENVVERVIARRQSAALFARQIDRFAHQSQCVCAWQPHPGARSPAFFELSAEAFAGGVDQAQVLQAVEVVQQQRREPDAAQAPLGQQPQRARAARVDVGRPCFSHLEWRLSRTRLGRTGRG